MNKNATTYSVLVNCATDGSFGISPTVGRFAFVSLFDTCATVDLFLVRLNFTQENLDLDLESYDRRHFVCSLFY